MDDDSDLERALREHAEIEAREDLMWARTAVCA
jgi:hypothetical protein